MTTSQKSRLSSIIHTIIYISQRFSLLTTALFSFLTVSFTLTVSIMGETLRNQIGYQGLSNPTDVDNAVRGLLDSMALAGVESALSCLLLTAMLLFFFKQQRDKNKQLALNTAITLAFCLLIIVLANAIVTSLIRNLG